MAAADSTPPVAAPVATNNAVEHSTGGANVETPQTLLHGGAATGNEQQKKSFSLPANTTTNGAQNVPLVSEIQGGKSSEIANTKPTTVADKDTKQDGAKDDSKENKKQNDKDADDSKSLAESEPAGGYDATPIPRMPAGYTLRITIHRAHNLPMADINSLSSDPYVITQVYTSNFTRHKEDPALKMRTFTIRRETEPEWNAQWIVANMPASGFTLKCRIYDEDPANHDDRLGNVHISVPKLDESWQGFNESSFKIKKRMGSKRAYAVQAMAAAIGKRKGMDGHLVVSIENLGRTESQHGGRIYTVGPAFWIKHYSPLLGRVMGQKTPGEEEKAKENKQEELDEKPKKEKPKSERYNFQANQLQLNGPVPAELYHRYVEFRPFVKRMFTGKGLRGFMMNKVLMHQHDQIYHFDRSTEYGYLSDKPTNETTLKFLDLVHYDEGGRIFTYILTLDALLRFTETGKEFGIQMLSKHTLHSCAETYIAFSGEFLIRRLKNKNEPPPEEGGNNESHPPSNFDGGEPEKESPKDPKYYELIIDNDSGTYRPNAKLLPKLKEFLERSLPGLHIVVLDCQADAEEQQRIKKEQLQKKKEEGDNIIYKPLSRGSSISSSDESDLDSIMGGGDHHNDFYNTIVHDLGARSKMKKQRVKKSAKGGKKKGPPRSAAATNGYKSAKATEKSVKR